MSPFVKCQYELCENTFKSFIHGKNIKRFCSSKCWTNAAYKAEKEIRDARKAEFFPLKQKKRDEFNQRFLENRYKNPTIPLEINL